MKTTQIKLLLTVKQVSHRKYCDIYSLMFHILMTSIQVQLGLKQTIVMIDHLLLWISGKNILYCNLRILYCLFVQMLLDQILA